MTSHNLHWRMLLPILFSVVLAARLHAAGEEPVVGNDQRTVVASLGDVTVQSIKAIPAINANGQIAMVVQIGAVKGRRLTGDEAVQVVVLRDKGKLAAIAQTKFPLAGHPKRVLQEIRSVMLSDDGSVLIEAELMGPDGKRRSGNSENTSLWHWRAGKLHLLLARDEPVGGKAGGPLAQDWHAVIADGGWVTVRLSHGTRSQTSGPVRLLAFKDGKLELTAEEVGARQGQTGVRYTQVHAAGAHTVVLRELIPPKGLPEWELCRMNEGKLEVIARHGDVPPEGLQGAEGRDRLVSPVSNLCVTSAGRVALSTIVSVPGKVNPARRALLISEPNFGPWRAVALRGEAAPGPGDPEYNVLEGPIAAANDGHLAFADVRSLYLYKPDGTVLKIADADKLPGVGEIRSLWTLSVADGGHTLIEVLAGGGVAAYAYDPRRGLRSLFEPEKSLPAFAGGKAQLVKVFRDDPHPNPLSRTGRYAFVWRGQRGTLQGGVATIDLTK